MRDDENRAFLSFSEKVAYRAIQRTSHFYGFAAPGDERERARDFIYFLSRGIEEDLSRRFSTQAKELVGLRFG
jgi:hypothetical protein